MDLNGISSLWKKYKKTKNLKTRNKLVENYLDLVKYSAKKIKKRLPSSVELNDLISAGVFGLINAVEAFDPSRGVKFETYCVHRIRGAILDEFRNTDWVPILVRKRVNRYRRVMRALSKKNGNDYVPTSQEIADYFGVSIKEAERIKVEGSIPIISCCNMEMRLEDKLDLKSPRPEDKASGEDDFNKLISYFTDREQIIIILYYRDNCTMCKIGEILNLSDGRISQIHFCSLEKIKKYLDYSLFFVENHKNTKTQF